MALQELGFEASSGKKRGVTDGMRGNRRGVLRFGLDLLVQTWEGEDGRVAGGADCWVFSFLTSSMRDCI